MGHVLMENRHGLVVDATLTHATGTAERGAALTMLERLDGHHRITLGAETKFSEATKPTIPPISPPICAR